MKTFNTVAELRAFRTALGGSVGFVPTMGALHPGHASLIERSVRENDATIVSIYVNPTQFDNVVDLEKYPQLPEADSEMVHASGGDAIFAPTWAEMYPDGFAYFVDETGLSQTLCGASRPGHFRGVLTVVMKLLSIVRPDRAYFGEKDYQQYLLIDGMAKAFHLETAIVPCPIVRESDGLAMSSRNLRLDACARAKAPLIHQLISSDLDDVAVIERLTDAGFRVDYVVTEHGRRFAAARIGEVDNEVRLIDNVAIEGVSP